MSGKENAIPTDALSDEEGAAIIAAHQQPKSAREQMMEEMEASRLAAFSSETGINPSAMKTELPDDAETGYVPPVAKAATTTDTDAQLAAQLADGEGKLLGDGLDKFRVRVKIDGEESDVSVEEMRRQYQKAGAADKRLAEATRLLEEAKKTVAAAPAPTPEPKVVDPNAPSPKKKFIEALFQGDEEGAIAAFDEAVGQGRQQPTPTVDDLVKAATPALRQQLVVDSALEKFQTDYADIVGEPYLAAKADSLLNAELANGKPFAEALENAGKGTRDWLTALTGGKPKESDPTTARTERLERKAGLDTVVGAGTKAVIPTPREQTPSDVIAEMRAQRGQLA